MVGVAANNKKVARADDADAGRCRQSWIIVSILRAGVDAVELWVCFPQFIS